MLNTKVKIRIRWSCIKRKKEKKLLMLCDVQLTFSFFVVFSVCLVVVFSFLFCCFVFYWKSKFQQSNVRYMKLVQESQWVINRCTTLHLHKKQRSEFIDLKEHKQKNYVIIIEDMLKDIAYLGGHTHNGCVKFSRT